MDLGRAAIVVAHPDDEILWFSSLSARVGRIIMCYGAVSNVPERAEQRRRVVAAYPRKNVQFLDLPQPRFFRGMSTEIFDHETRELAEEDPTFRAALIDRIRPALSGFTTVFVHNPWGEYGHQDHRRVNMVVNALRGEMEFAVYVSCYVERQVAAHAVAMLDQGVRDTVSFSVSWPEIEPIFRLYQAHSCWTWTTNWNWPREEHFVQFGSGGSPRAGPIPLDFFDVRWD
jgi:LmbE family N-acetylglucosaminyl deacetylase